MKVYDSQGREKLAGGGGADGLNRISAGTQIAGTLATVVFSNSNNVTFGMTNSSIITASVTVGSTQGSINLSAGTTSNLASAFTFANSNGLAFGLNASTITGSYTVPTVPAQFTGGFSTNGNTLGDTGLVTGRVVLIGGNNITLSGSTNAGSISVTISGPNTAAQSNQQMTMFATGNTTLSSSGTSNASSLVFRGSGAASVGITNGSILIDVAAAITQSIGMSTQTAGGATAGTTGYATGDDVRYHFVPGSNITMSQSVNGASATLSIYGDGATLSGWNPFPGPALWVTSGIGNASLFLRPIDVPGAFQYDRMVMPMHFSQATGSTLTVSNTVAWGFYSRNVSTLSLYKSGSGTFSINGSGTASSDSNSGIRVVSFASTDTITAGNYYLGFVWRTSSAGANASLSYIAISQWASTISGYMGQSTNTRMVYHPAGGVWTSTTAGPVPGSVAFSAIRGNSSEFQRQPVFHFTSGEIRF